MITNGDILSLINTFLIIWTMFKVNDLTKPSEDEDE